MFLNSLLLSSRIIPLSVVSVMTAASLLLGGEIAAQSPTLTATGRTGSTSSRITYLDSVSGSAYSTPAEGLQVWCVNAGVQSAAYYSGENPAAPALNYQVLPFSTVSGNAAAYFDNDSSWPEYDTANDPFGLWAQAALEYAFTFEDTFRDQVALDGYYFENYYMQTLVSEIAHEGPTTFGGVTDHLGNRGNYFGGASLENSLVDAYFSWMMTGTATLDGYTWTNSSPLLTATYDNPDIQILFLNRDRNEPNFELTQDYIAIVPTTVPEPSGALLVMLTLKRKMEPEPQRD